MTSEKYFWMASEQDGKITKIVFQVLSYWTDDIKLHENWWTICSFPLTTMCQIIFVRDYFLICANCGVDHKTVSSSSMWLAGERKGAIQEYFFGWHKDEWSIVLLSEKKKANSTVPSPGEITKYAFKLKLLELPVPSFFNILLLVIIVCLQNMFPSSNCISFWGHGTLHMELRKCLSEWF